MQLAHLTSMNVYVTHHQINVAGFVTPGGPTVYNTSTERMGVPSRKYLHKDIAGGLF